MDPLEGFLLGHLFAIPLFLLALLAVAGLRGSPECVWLAGWGAMFLSAIPLAITGLEGLSSADPWAACIDASPRTAGGAVLFTAGWYMRRWAGVLASRPAPHPSLAGRYCTSRRMNQPVSDTSRIAMQHVSDTACIATARAAGGESAARG